MKCSTVLACLGLLVVGCGEADPQPLATPEPQAKPAAPTASDFSKATIEYDTRIETKDGKSTIYWTAKVPTGGWTMTLDRPPLVEESMTLWWARVWVTLTAPAPDEMVTQGVQTLEEKFEADKKINRVEFSVRRKVKGVESQWAPLYSVVKTGPDWVTPEDKANP